MPRPKVLIVHGLGGKPNGGWRPWLLTALAEKDVFAFALAMPAPDAPVLDEWLAELARYVERYKDDDLYLVGHSLGGATILRYLEKAPQTIRIAGMVLVSAPFRPNKNPATANFFVEPIDLEKVRVRGIPAKVVHGDDDAVVPIAQGHAIADGLGCELIRVPKGGHLGSSDGWKQLPQLLDVLDKMMSR
jgi:predicted alpha/beta hydrolase family esterase